MNDRYSWQGDTDSNLVTQGDEQIVGMDARTQPERLEPGYAQFLQNMRLDTLEVSVRKGMAKQTNSITPSSAPLLIPFIVGSGALIGGAPNDGIFASCVFSDPNNNNALYLFFVTAQKVYTFSSATSAVTTIAYPSNELVELVDKSTDIFQVGGSVYLLRGDLGISFVLSVLTSSGTTATLTTVGNHGLASNMYIRIGGANQAPYNGDFQITVTGLTTFTYVMASAPGVSPATGTITVNRLKTPLVWAGVFGQPFTLNPYGVISQNFFNMPVSNWGLLQQNRAILEYGRNQVIISQPVNAASYDIINGVFTFAPGTNDYVVAAAPYQDTQTLVFLRQSVWLINGVNGDVATMTQQLITAQVGCCSRHSVATCGANVLFLNERGVFMLQPGYELTLRGNSLPLSAPVDSIIQTINFNALNKPYAAYQLNRYYLAIPVNGSTRNNAMIVYNFINQAWESYDTFPNGFYCDELQVMLNASGVPTLYAISYEGGLYAYEQNEMDDFAAAGSPATQYLINGQFRTRRFTFGTPGLKRFNRVISVVNLDANSSMTATAFTINPEDTKTLPTVTNVAAGQTTRPGLISKRAYAIEILYQNTANRGAILNYNIGAYVKDLKGTKTT
jgi:hypothetical protein